MIKAADEITAGSADKSDAKRFCHVLYELHARIYLLTHLPKRAPIERSLAHEPGVDRIPISDIGRQLNTDIGHSLKPLCLHWVVP